MHLAPFLIYILATFVLTAVTSYPVFLGLEALGLRDMPFDEMVMRLLRLYGLMGLWPLLSSFGINTPVGWGYGPSRVGRGVFKGLLLGAAIGIASMALVVLVPPSVKPAVTTPPVQVVDALAGVATTMPPGRRSVNARLLAACPLAVLSMVNVRVLVSPGVMVLGEKLLLNPGLPASTVRVAVAVPLLPALDVRSPETFV